MPRTRERNTAAPTRAIPLAARRRLAVLAGATPGISGEVVRCAYCGSEGRIGWALNTQKTKPSYWVTFPGMDIDHIVPVEHGGPSTITNLALVCSRCNRSKGHKHLCEWRGIA